MRWRWGVVGCLMLQLAADPAAAAPVRHTATSILIDATTGRTLREHDADAVRRSGSLNHLMVVLLSMEQAALGALPLEVPVTVSQRAVASGRHGDRATPRHRIRLRAERTYLLSDLLKAVLITGADDAIIAAAEAIAGSLPACLEAMNARAQRLGMEATYYASIGGATPRAAARADITTARDVVRLARALVRHATVLQWASFLGLPFDRGATVLRNVNQLLGVVVGVDGLYVSSSQDAGYSVVATAQRDALRLIAVVLEASSNAARYTTAAELLEWGFAHYQRLEVVKRGERLNVPVRVENGSIAQINPIAAHTLSLLQRRDEERELLVRYQLPAVVSAPLSRHQAIGELIVEQDGELIAVIPVVSPEAVPPRAALSLALP